MWRALIGWAGFVACALLAGCGGRHATDSAAVSGDQDPTTTSSISVSSAKPVDAYVILGGRIKTCWFNPTKPLLPAYVYRADVAADGSKVEITIHDREDLGRAGMSTYAIDFTTDGPSTVVTTENRTMPPEIAAKMQADINRWKLGDAGCSTDWPKVSAAASPPAGKAAAKPMPN